MDSSKFLSADDLGLDHNEYESLLEVLTRLESGEIVYDPTCSKEAEGFNYGSVAVQRPGGVCACILGWSKIIGGDTTFESTVAKLAFDPVRKLLPVGRRLSALFDLLFGPIDRKWDLSSVTTQQAALALRNYLTTGVPRWEEVMAKGPVAA